MQTQVLPSVDDVALLLRTRTVGPPSGSGLGGDTGPSDSTTFTSSTRPTATEVTRIIATAYGAIMPQLASQPVTEDQMSGAKHAVAMYAAQLISMSFFPETSKDEMAFWGSELKVLLQGLNDAMGVGTARPGFGLISLRSDRDVPLPLYAPDSVFS